MKFIQCQKCYKNLLKIGSFDSLSIKCLRCKTLNYLSVKNALPEDHESQTKETYECSNQPTHQPQI